MGILIYSKTKLRQRPSWDNNNSRFLYSAHPSLSDAQCVFTYSIFLQVSVTKIRDLFLYIAPCNGLRGAVAQYAANPARNTGADPFSLR